MGASQTDKKDEATVQPPSTKKPKLKQTSLFDVLKPKPMKPVTKVLSPIQTNAKKRKSESSYAGQRPCKIAKSDDSITKGSKLKFDDGENEVSSSSEPDGHKISPSNLKEKQNSKNVKTLDAFLRTTQAREISTSCTDEQVIDLVSSETEEKSLKEEVKLNNVDSKENQLLIAKEAASVLTESPKEETTSSDNGKSSPMEETKTITADGDSTDNQNAVLRTPKSAAPKKAVKSTSKKLELEQERERLREEKEKQKQLEKEEKLKQKEAAKAEKEKLKREEKERKEKEKADQKLAKEKEKQEKLELLQKEKEEKLKKKQAELEAKNEEKRKKEEERKKAEDEKKRMEEEKVAKQRQNKEKFKSFFKAPSKAPVGQAKVEPENEGKFFAFEVKENMRMAPTLRIAIPNDSKENLEGLLKNQQETHTFFKDLKEQKRRFSLKTWPQDDKDVELVEDDTKKNGGTMMKAKLLQFHENYRPAYYGTWRKKSAYISARKPLAKDTELFDYEVESDDEWEEEEPGESLSHSEKEDEKEDGEDDDDEDDGFFVPHGYLSEDEVCEEEDDDITPERMKARQLAKAKAFDEEMKKQTQVMSALVIGCVWWNPLTSGSSDPNYNKLAQYSVQRIGADNGPIEVDIVENKSNETEMKSGNKSEDTKTNKSQPVPNEAVSDLVRLVHGNSSSIQKLIKEFQEYWMRKMNNDLISSSNECAMEVDESPKSSKQAASTVSDTPTNKAGVISKRQLDLKIKKMAVYDKKKCAWFVNQALLEELNLTDLPVPCQWQWITRVNTPQVDEKVLSTPKSGRRTPTIVTTPVAPSIKNFTVEMTPEQLSKSMPKPQPRRITPSPSPLQTMLFKTQASNVTSTTKEAPEQTTTNVNGGKTAAAAASRPVQKVPKAMSMLQRMILEAKSRKPGDAKAVVNCDTSVHVDDDDDCMIVEEPSLPIVAPKGQPTLLSVFKKSQ